MMSDKLLDRENKAPGKPVVNKKWMIFGGRSRCERISQE